MGIDTDGRRRRMHIIPSSPFMARFHGLVLENSFSNNKRNMSSSLTQFLSSFTDEPAVLSYFLMWTTSSSRDKSLAEFIYSDPFIESIDLLFKHRYWIPREGSFDIYSVALKLAWNVSLQKGSPMKKIVQMLNLTLDSSGQYIPGKTLLSLLVDLNTYPLKPLELFGKEIKHSEAWEFVFSRIRKQLKSQKKEGDVTTFLKDSLLLLARSDVNTEGLLSKSSAAKSLVRLFRQCLLLGNNSEHILVCKGILKHLCFSALLNPKSDTNLFNSLVSLLVPASLEIPLLDLYHQILVALYQDSARTRLYLVSDHSNIVQWSESVRGLVLRLSDGSRPLNTLSIRLAKIMQVLQGLEKALFSLPQDSTSELLLVQETLCFVYLLRAKMGYFEVLKNPSEALDHFHTSFIEGRGIARRTEVLGRLSVLVEPRRHPTSDYRLDEGEMSSPLQDIDSFLLAHILRSPVAELEEKFGTKPFSASEFIKACKTWRLSVSQSELVGTLLRGSQRIVHVSKQQTPFAKGTGKWKFNEEKLEYGEKSGSAGSASMFFRKVSKRIRSRRGTLQKCVEHNTSRSNSTSSIGSMG